MIPISVLVNIPLLSRPTVLREWRLSSPVIITGTSGEASELATPSFSLLICFSANATQDGPMEVAYLL